MNWVTIRYRDFYDFPRIFITALDGKQYLFDCPFDDDLDEYSDRYRVYQLPAIDSRPTGDGHLKSGDAGCRIRTRLRTGREVSG